MTISPRPRCSTGFTVRNATETVLLMAIRGWKNKWWLKSSGRYPTIPQVYDLLDEEAQRLQVVNVSEYDQRWPKWRTR